MTENVPQSSASDRYEAARRAIMWLSVQLDGARAVVEEIEESRDAHDVQGLIDARDSADSLLQHLLAHGQTQLAALRALITPPSVGESEEQIAARVLRISPPPMIDSDGRLCFDLPALANLGSALIRAGIQSAHETWEPEVAQRPSQEQMLRWLGIEAEEVFIGSEMESMYFVPEQYIERDEI